MKLLKIKLSGLQNYGVYSDDACGGNDNDDDDDDDDDDEDDDDDADAN